MGRSRLAVALLVTLAVLGVTAIAATRAPTGDSRSAQPRSALDLSSQLRSAVTVDGIMEHERRFQEIADEHGGNRAAGTPGYDASAAYVAGELREAGYEVTVQRFRFPFYGVVEPARLERRGTGARKYARGEDFVLMEYSGSGAANARLGPVEAGRRSSTSGCESGDFAGFPEGRIALLRRGGCTFFRKATNAEGAGASAVLISNDGGPGRRGELRGTLGAPGIGIPVFGTSTGAGRELLAAARSGGEVFFSAKTISKDQRTSNVIAESPGGDEGRTVMLGAHLDSVPQGPGINDNGSGSATVLEIAVQMSRLGLEPENRLRFAFWGAEELGLIGSMRYVDRLSEDEIDDVYAYLNFDMVGSHNFVRDVYEGPDVTEGVFVDYFDSKGIEVEVTSALDGRSDHGPFAAEDVRTGGLFSGAEGIKTEQEAEAFGGEAGAPHDPCYHEACDNLDNLDKRVLDQFSDAAAHAAFTLARRDAE